MSSSQQKMLKKTKGENKNFSPSEKEGSPLWNLSYEERLIIIMDFFGISRKASKFIYHRKRRGYPFKKRDDFKFLEWDLRLQNALVKADECIDWDWNELKFGYEEHVLSQNDILLEDQSDTDIFKHEKKKMLDDGWTLVKDSKRLKQRQIKVLQTLGFLPRFRDHKKYVNTPRKASEEKIYNIPSGIC
jgi:hypothetical protein